MINKKTWKEFQESGLFWWINMILHTFGWAIVIEQDKETKETICAYPARVSFRGFDNSSNSKGYINVSQYMKDNADELLEESKE